VYVHARRGAQFAGQRQLPVINVDCDDHSRSRKTSTLHSRQAYRAATNHHYGISTLYVSNVKRRANSGHDRTSDETRPIVGHVWGDGDSLLVLNDAVFAKRSNK
jgi:hypothetical protein